MRKWPQEIKDFIAANVAATNSIDLARGINEQFGTNVTAAEVRSYKKNHHLRSGIRTGPPSKFPWGMLEFVRENAEGVSNEEMTRMVNERFGAGTATLGQIKAYKKNHHISSGMTGQFNKGNVSWNKGRPMSEWMSPEGIERSSRTRFRKGSKPLTEKPLGTITRSQDGYLWIKLSSIGRRRCDNWMQLQRYVWEFHNGPIPEGMLVVFLDGDKDNCDISNLALVTRREHLQLTHSRLRSTEPELTRSGIAVARLMVRAKEVRDDRGVASDQEQQGRAGHQ